MKKATITGDRLTILWSGVSGDEWRAILETVKEIPGRRFNAPTKTWSAPVSEEALSILTEIGFTIEGGAQVQKNEQAAPVDLSGLAAYPASEKLHPYQRAGVAFLLRNNRALLADDCGLGKTSQAIFALALRNAWPALIIVPASLKLNWAKELKLWAGLDCTIISGSAPVSDYGKITVINYDILKNHVPELKKQKYKTVILEESHYCKNPKTKRTKAVQALCKGVENVIAISGTPVVNRPSEFFTVLNLLDRYRFPDFWHFANRYCGATHNGFGWDFSGSSNTEELREILNAGLMIRRKKEDVLSELPAKTRAVVPFGNKCADEYRAARQELVDALSADQRAQAIVMINKLRQIAVRAKLEDCIAWIGDVLNNDKKLVVFAVHHFVIDAIMAAFGDAAVKIDGRDNTGARDTAVTRFQGDDGVRLFVGNIKAAGVGITLTAASDVAFVETAWSPGDMEQAIDRCHRIGQRDAVTAWFLIAEGTIEEDMAALLDSKSEQLAALMDGVVVDEDSLLTSLLRKIGTEKR
jgi:SWI/SNF-related matrix-associated actin-dependent regulator of chromatin subfamily A-like protein 1